MSDLHLETHPSYNFKLKQSVPYLALLGDIGHVGDDLLFSFLEKQLGHYWVVFFLLGNHDPSHLSWASAKRRVQDFATKMDRLRSKSTIGKFVFLDQTRYDLNDKLTILGCTLFSRVAPEQSAAVATRLVDFRNITNWTVRNHIDAHLSDLRWLNTQVSEISRAEPHRQIAIFTHHSPSMDRRSIDQAHKNSEVTSGFATDLGNEECWKSPSVVMWAFGHTHFNCDFVDELGKRVVTNQKGYYSVPKESFEMTKPFVVGRDEEGRAD
ncbi:hypothetical protein FGG08_000382 [Glutinoglossum americanum]|uniref:Calcineurin-like phosphoesterase domain-containing protein n=1 Tax=Glutinoglossum americanum TaxID=1670608 RepID=A0A9P8I3Z7_9PEZI|nr:hypothetical protein FGG08_000382 [Glutinoglossum americanum]